MTETVAKRARRTPQEIAQDNLAGAKNRHMRALRKVNELRDQLADAEEELKQAVKYVGYAEQHPDLPDTFGGDALQANGR